MTGLTIEPLGQRVGAEITGLDRERVESDPSVAGACMDALEQFGVLVLRGMGLDDSAQVRFCRRLGRPEARSTRAVPEIAHISLDPDRSPIAGYLQGTFDWHIDGTCDDVPAKATVLTAHAVAEQGGETEFAGTYAAYDALGPEEQERLARLRVVHTFEASQRRYVPDPTPEQMADWRTRKPMEHPLVWRHRSGRRSLVLGATADHVVGLEPEASRTLLDDLLERATSVDQVYRHTWSVGDTVIWDNCGVLHRALPYRADSAREMHRTTLLGDEPIQ
ncbi:MAG: TauD/TfdA family dioxygenase [Actinomycetota bacterium]|nr:TauD/TfdA family dioxygenase [Actinomycetota bacterium]